MQTHYVPINGQTHNSLESRIETTTLGEKKRVNIEQNLDEEKNHLQRQTIIVIIFQLNAHK